MIGYTQLVVIAMLKQHVCRTLHSLLEPYDLQAYVSAGGRVC